jgi:hypothetical protein
MIESMVEAILFCWLVGWLFCLFVLFLFVCFSVLGFELFLVIGFFRELFARAGFEPLSS